MRRRKFIALFGIGAVPLFWPVPSIGASKILRLGIVAATPRKGPLWVAFEQRLRELEYVDGQNLAVEFI